MCCCSARRIARVVPGTTAVPVSVTPPSAIPGPEWNIARRPKKRNDKSPTVPGGGPARGFRQGHPAGGRPGAMRCAVNDPAMPEHALSVSVEGDSFRSPPRHRVVPLEAPRVPRSRARPPGSTGSLVAAALAPRYRRDRVRPEEPRYKRRTGATTPVTWRTASSCRSRRPAARHGRDPPPRQRRRALRVAVRLRVDATTAARGAPPARARRGRALGERVLPRRPTGQETYPVGATWTPSRSPTELAPRLQRRIQPGLRVQPVLQLPAALEGNTLPWRSARRTGLALPH